MDRITKSLLDDFVSNNGLEKVAEETAFERFTGYLVTSQHFTETFSSEDIHVGAGADCGIDNISIIVNGCLIVDPDEIEDLENTNGYIDATFIFNQAERSSSFDAQKLGNFGFGVKDFLSESPKLPQNDGIKLKAKIINEVFKRSSKFKRGNPQCFLYYTTTGKWVGDLNLEARRNAVSEDLHSLNIFRKVEVECVDAEKIQKLFRQTKNAISTEINFPNKTVLPELPGIEQAYIGYLSSTEYLKLIENNSEEIITSIFYDNVRHFQEWNKVNKEMKETLENSVQNVYFPILNNGVTIIARKIHSTANKFTLEDYQIVNGCQTSFVLSECREHLNPNVLIPVRIISTADSEIRNSIIKATNRQTEVTEEQLFALSDFPKRLETYFPTFEGSKKLYYERRSRQYNADETVEKGRVINMTMLVRAFASTFLSLPHRTTRNYKALIKSVGTSIFDQNHKLEMYYVAAFANFKLDQLFTSNELNTNLKQARYVMLYAFRILVVGDSLPRANSHDMGRSCTKMMDVLWDEKEAKEVFIQAAKIVDTIAAGNYYRDNIMTENFTENVKVAALGSRKNKTAANTG